MDKKIRLHMDERVFQETYAAMDVPGAVIAGFNLGLRVAESINGINVGETPAGKVHDLLVAIANGEETPILTTAEIQKKYPHASDVANARREHQTLSQVAAFLFLTGRKTGS